MEEIDIHLFSVKKKLWYPWGKRFLGWTLNENGIQEAIFMRVPGVYPFKGKVTKSTPEQRFFNEIRFTESDVTYTFFFKRIGAQVWDKDLKFFEEREEKIKQNLGVFPDYFGILNALSEGKISVQQIEDMHDPVIEVWR